MSVNFFKLGDLVKIAPNKRANKNTYDVLSMTRSRGLVLQSSVFNKSIASRDLSKYKIVSPNQLVVGIHIDEGALGFSGPNDLGIVSPAYRLWDLSRSDLVHVPYLDKFIRSDRAIKYFISKYRETAERRGKLTNEQFLDLDVPLPPLSEQKRIAAILDAADALREKRKKTIAKLDALIQSTFLEMFGDPVTNPKGWDQQELIKVCFTADDIRCGPFGTQLQVHEFRKCGVPLWGIKHVNSGFVHYTSEFVSPDKAKQLKNYDLKSGDLVMTRKGTIGNCHIYPNNFVCGIMHSDLLRVRVNTSVVNPIFLSYQLTFSRRIKRQLEIMSPGAVMPGINVSKLKSLIIESPPVEIQNQFASIVAEISKQKALFQTSETSFGTLFASLQSRAFKGEL